MMNNKKISLSLATFLCASGLNAYEMGSVGYKATGMGGAGVASSRGGMATYYNPALVGFSDYTSQFTLDLGVSVRENGLVDAADQLNTLELSESLDTIADSNITGTDLTDEQKKPFDNVEAALEVLNKIPQGNGLQVIPRASFTAQMSKYFAIGAYASSEIRANMTIDKTKLGLIFDTDAGYVEYNNGSLSASTQKSYEALSLQYAIQGSDPDNEDDAETTYLNISALSLAEVPISFATTFEQRNGTLSLGITGKPMIAETFSKKFTVDTKSGDIADEYKENSKQYSTVGVDLGIAYRENNTGLIIGLVGKNINKPTFETEPDKQGNIETFALDPFFRAGLSLPVWNDNVEFAIDADLQQSDTSYEGMKSQYVGGGFEFHPASWFALRAGAMKNVATESIDEGFIYTAGLGFGLKWLQLDLSAQMAQEKARYDGEEIPKYVAVNFSLISRWGDGYKRKVPPKTTEATPTITEPSTQTPISEEEINRINNDAKKADQELDQAL